ncbi:MAG: AraC family transcriptional regulator [Bacteroidota bacterium]
MPPLRNRLLNNSLPDYFAKNGLKSEAPVSAFNYRTAQEIIKNKVVLRTFLFSFLLEGRKMLHHLHDEAVLGPDHFLLLKPTHCLMTERFVGTNEYRSLLCFFESAVLHRFTSKYQLTNRSEERVPDFLVLPVDAYVNHFVQGMQALLAQPLSQNSSIWQLKIEELLLYLVEQHGDILVPFLCAEQTSSTDGDFRRVIEGSIDQKLTLDELAFLCQMSLSTFKRKFKELYQNSPARWFQKQRLLKAKRLLVHFHQSPSEVYLEAGFENFSSFSQAFKREFGVSPKVLKANSQ